jgi:hypothetical protein
MTVLENASFPSFLKHTQSATKRNSAVKTINENFLRPLYLSDPRFQKDNDFE